MTFSRRSIVTMLVLLIALVPAAFAAPTADGPSKAVERVDGKFDRGSFVIEMTSLHDRLMASRVDGVAVSPLRVDVDLRELEDDGGLNAVQRKMKVGVTEQLNVPVSFDNIRGQLRHERAHDFGAIRGGENNFVWSGAVESPGAAAIRIHISDFDLAEGNELYVYNAAGMAFGPYTGLGPNGTGEFWTNTVTGSDVTLQVHHQGATTGLPSFTVSGVAHLTSAFKLSSSLSPRPQAGDQNCSFNADCVVGAGCVQNHSAVNTAADAVAHMLFASGRYMYICSGGLIADSDPNTDVPYFVTANHCISRSTEAQSLETYFFYTSDCGTCPSAGSTPSTNGASIVATNSTSDYTLLQLSQSAPGGAAFLGWDAAPVANSNGAHLYRLSHPQGAPQSYSEHDVDTTKGTCGSWPRGDWIYSRDVLGATEGGSSGSPVVNASGQLVGQLSGACGYNVNDNCDTESNATVDGAFAAYYDEVSQYLGTGDPGGNDPEDCSDGVDNDGDGLVDCEDGDCASDPACEVGSCTDNDGDGYCAEEGDCDDGNSTIHPGATEICGDGIDNDCDGSIDEGCSTGGITLAADAYKVRGRKHADLSWSGASSTNVDIYRDGSVIATTANDGEYTDATNSRGGGSFTYQVCEAGTSTCSSVVTVTF